MFNLEGEFVCYLKMYGNTKKDDLTEFGKRISNLSPDKINLVLEKMVLEGKATRVVHSKIGPEIVYFSRENCVEYELSLEIEAEARDLKNKDVISEEAGRILREAAASAENRIRKRFPEKFRKHA